MPTAYKKEVGGFSLLIAPTVRGQFCLHVDGQAVSLFDKPYDALADLFHGHVSTFIGERAPKAFNSGENLISMNIDDWIETEMPTWEELQ